MKREPDSSSEGEVPPPPAAAPEGDAEMRVVRLEEEVRRLTRETQRQAAKLQILNEIGRAINSVLDLDRLFVLICDLTTRKLECDLGSIMLVEESSLVMKAARGIPPEISKKIRMKVGEGIAGAVAASGKAVLVRDVGKDERVRRDIGTERRKRYAGASFASVPIVLEQRVIGVLNVTNKRGANELGDDDLEFLETIAAQSAVAIDNARLLRETQVLATTDGLTGLFNHRYLHERMNDEIERYRRYKRKGVSLVMFDIDHFKRVNDKHGHGAGDEVLRGVARRLRTRARKVDVCGRYGGEEFCVILPEVGKRGAVAYAQRVLKSLEEESLGVRELTEPVAMSAGVATSPDDAETSADLFEAADRALYAAKEGGRNRVCVAGKDLQASAQQALPSGEDRGQREEE